MASAELSTPKLENSHSFIDRDDIEDVAAAIGRNQYYTNHGPLAKQFESKLEDWLDIDHVVTVGNDTLAFLIAVAGLHVEGSVMVPALGGRDAENILSWLKLSCQVCDVDAETHQPGENEIGSAIRPDTAAIVLVELWGRRADQRLLRSLAEDGKRVVVVAFDSMGSLADERRVLTHPNVVTIFAFGPNRTIDTLQGGAIATTDGRLAEIYRNIRSSYGSRSRVAVRATCNGRFSELQAGLGLRELARVEEKINGASGIAAYYRESFKTDFQMAGVSYDGQSRCVGDLAHALGWPFVLRSEGLKRINWWAADHTCRCATRLQHKCDSDTPVHARATDLCDVGGIQRVRFGASRLLRKCEMKR